MMSFPDRQPPVPAPDDLADRLDALFPPGAGDAVFPLDGDPRVRAAWQIARGPFPALDSEAEHRIAAQIDAAAQLQHAGHPALPDQTVAQIERRILRGSRRHSIPQFGPKRVAALGRIAAALVVTLAALLLTLFATLTVSAESLPGETLYPVKRAAERAELALAGDSQSADLRLEFAGRRLDEFERLLARGDLRPGTLDSAAREMESALAHVNAGSAGLLTDRVLALAARYNMLAEQAGVRALEDGVQLAQVVHGVARVDALTRRAHDLRASVLAPEAGIIQPAAYSGDIALHIPADQPELRPQSTSLEATATGLY